MPQLLAAQTPVSGLAAPPPGPLRAEGALGSGSGGKMAMVSLEDLHYGATAPPPAPPAAAPGPAPCLEIDLGVDPLDPLLQLLVQDKLFAVAVQTSQLHAAAATAVKLLRERFAAAPAPHAHAHAHHHHHSHHHGAHAALAQRPVAPRAGPGRLPANGYAARSAAAHRHAPAHAVLSPALRFVKQEMLDVEDAIPWAAVRRVWRTKRTAWRRQVKQTELIAELAVRLRELRAALTPDDADAGFVGCAAVWRAQVEACARGRGAAPLLAACWEEMKQAIRSWLDGTGPDAGTARAVRALHAALRAGGGADALLQAPLEAVVGGDAAALHAVRQAIELERRVVAARLAAAHAGGAAGAAADPAAAAALAAAPPLTSYFSSIAAAWEDSDFDSGAETEVGADDGDATDVEGMDAA